MGQRVAGKRHAPKDQEDAERRAESASARADKRPSHEFIIGEWRDGSVSQYAAYRRQTHRKTFARARRLDIARAR
jgi:hypothetical protein